MIRGLYTAASGMLAGERKQDIISNNLANVNTVGYKKDDSLMRSFPEMLLYSMNDHTGSGPQQVIPGSPGVGSLGTGAFLEEVLARFTPGILKPTNNKYGYAIVDKPVPDPNSPTGVNEKEKSFFALNDGNGGTLVSRDGDFHTDQQGYLINAAGLSVQAVDADGLPVANSRVRLNNTETGLIAGRVDAAGQFTEDAALRFGIVDVLNADLLQNGGNNAYRVEADNLGQASGEMRQGFVEGSNVDMAQTMTDMIEVMRAYEANQRVIRTLDSTLDKAVNSLGRL
jgi:flagellar basal-body rod protein FlgG